MYLSRRGSDLRRIEERTMDMISRIQRAVEAALEELRSRARAEGWDEERVEREKRLFELGHEVTLCATPGCMKMAEPLPGFRDIPCPECAKR
jgi:hypothetical protein